MAGTCGSTDHISHAQCALLDETVLGCADEAAHAQWAAEPLQAKFFNRHQAGEFLYEDMREVLREPAPDPQVLTVFQRILMLGFKGRYRELDHPERRQLLTALNAHVAPLQTHHGLVTSSGGRRWFERQRWVRSTWVQILAMVVLLIGVWWGLDHLLGRAIVTLMPGQV